VDADRDMFAASDEEDGDENAAPARAAHHHRHSRHSSRNPPLSEGHRPLLLGLQRVKN